MSAMDAVGWVGTATTFYFACSAARIAAYVPQIATLVKHGRADGVCATSWWVFAVTHASTLAYALVVTDDAWLAAISAVNAVACAAIAALARWRQKTAPPCLTSADAAFLDAVAGDDGRPVGLHLRPLGDATRVGVRASRVKGAA